MSTPEFTTLGSASRPTWADQNFFETYGLKLIVIFYEDTMGWQPYFECYICESAGNDKHLDICVRCIDKYLDPPSKNYVETTISCGECHVCGRKGQFVVCIKTCGECDSDLYKKGHATRLADKQKRAAQRKQDWVDNHPVEEFLSESESEDE
jgi:hypothetical protein